MLLFEGMEGGEEEKRGKGNGRFMRMDKHSDRFKPARLCDQRDQPVETRSDCTLAKKIYTECSHRSEPVIIECSPNPTQSPTNQSNAFMPQQ